MVVDEADLLLTGGFERDVRKILQSMRAADKAKASQLICREAGVSFDHFLQLPKGLRQKALEGFSLSAATVSVHLSRTRNYNIRVNAWWVCCRRRAARL